MDTLLFKPLQIRGVQLKNRIVLSPMLTYSAVDGDVGDWHLMHLGKYEHAERIWRDAGIMTMAVGHIIHADQAEAILQGGRADLVAIGREMLHNPNWPIDAAQKLGVASGFAQAPPPYAYWLEKRAQSRFPGRPSTWQRGIDAPAQVEPVA